MISKLLCLALALAAPTAAIRRIAPVVIENETGEPLYGVSILHKWSSWSRYSSEYRTWSSINDANRGEPSLQARYETETGSDGKDYWLVNWYNRNGTTMYFSDPGQTRTAIDFESEAVQNALDAVTKAFERVVSDERASAGAVAVAPSPQQGISDAAGALIKPIISSGRVNGLDTHTLDLSDEGSVVRFIIKKQGKITIQSRNLTSEVVYKSKTFN